MSLSTYFSLSKSFNIVGKCKNIKTSVNMLVPVFQIRVHLILIRFQHFRLNTDPDSDQGFDDPKKNLQRKEIAMYLSLDLHKGPLSYRRSRQPSNIHQFELSYFLFQFLWVIFCLDPDSECGSGYGSRRAKMTHKSRKFLKFHVLQCWMASFES